MDRIGSESLRKIIAGWPKQTPLCLFGGSERFSFLPVAFTPVTFRDCYDCHFNRELVLCDATPFQSGLMGLLNYSNLDDSYILQVSKALVIDWQTGESMFVGDDHHDQYHVEEAQIADILASQDQACPPSSIHLESLLTEEEYLARAEQVLEDIRNGRFYQLNLLRYFHMRGQNIREACVEKFRSRQAQMSVWVEWDDQIVVSYSPERFVRIRPEHRHYIIETFPVKGTAKRHSDAAIDQELQQELFTSSKDRAELAMIIDLMRNDFYDISKKHSIKVKNPGSLLSNTHIHHLQGHIQAQLREDVSFGELVQAVFPAGSITGAPKKEVMQAIRDYEGCERGFFMGSAFYWDARGFFDSSVLIRTAICHKQSWQYAAGSGLVVKSIAEQERLEIANKCRVILRESE